MKTIITALFASVIALSLSTAPAKAADNTPKASYWTSYCCDAAGVRRCVLPAAVQDGTPCYCNYQGDGFAC